MRLPTNQQTGILVVSAIAASITFLVYFMLIGGYGFISGLIASLICAILVALLIYLFLMTGHGAKFVGEASSKLASTANKAQANLGEMVSEAKRKAEAMKEERESSAKAEADAGDNTTPETTVADTQNTAPPVVSTEAPQADPTPPATPAEDGVAAKPKGLGAPPEGEADDLKRIKGVGPKLETILNEMGIYQFGQIAAWTDAEIAWVDENLTGFKGRASRDNWVEQSKSLASGD